MVKVDLNGIAKVRTKGHTYWYAWRRGPRLTGEPASPEFINSYNETIEQRRNARQEALPLHRDELQGERRLQEPRRADSRSMGQMARPRRRILR
jgi:hypothetical protein